MAEIDGVPISEIIKRGEGGVYMRVEATSERELASRKTFTCFVGYEPYDPGDGENGPRIEWRWIEEIDVSTTDETDARVICELAMEEDFVGDGQILDVRENIPGMIYF